MKKILEAHHSGNWDIDFNKIFPENIKWLESSLNQTQREVWQDDFERIYEVDESLRKTDAVLIAEVKKFLNVAYDLLRRSGYDFTVDCSNHEVFFAELPKFFEKYPHLPRSLRLDMELQVKSIERILKR